MGLKIGKSAKKQEIKNPLRPVYGLQRKYTTCKITEEGARNMLAFMPELTLRLDADEEPLFLKEFEHVISKEERYRDNDKEVWYVDSKHAEFLTSTALEYFAEVIFEDEKGNIRVLKSPFATPVEALDGKGDADISGVLPGDVEGRET